MTENAQPGTRITPPPDFPVTWEQPEQAELHWTRDREHLPDPITPMFNSCAAAMAIASRNRSAARLDEALVARYDRPINHYLYTSVVAFRGTPGEMEARARRNREKSTAIALRLREIWEREWLPGLESHWAFWASFDLAGADLPALARHLEDSLAHGARLYEIHYYMTPPLWFAIHEFETLYCDLFPAATALDAHRLLQGFDNKTLEIGRALWRLSRLARTCPAVRAVIERHTAAEALTALEQSEDGRGFLDELRAFLRAYGGRSNLWDWGYPSWEDDPTPVFGNLKHYVTQPDRDLAAERAAAAAEREAAVAGARAALSGYPQPVIDRFETWLQAAQLALVLTENHTYYIDFNGFGWIRRVISEFGRRFAAQGRLDDASDIFYLELDELRALAADPELDLSALAVRRRAEMAYWAGYDEPRELGTRPAEAPYLYSADARRVMRYVGGMEGESPAADDEPGVLHGQAGSSGRVVGTARVIRTLADAGRLQRGDILVTTTTAPPWTPLFLTVAGVVTDAGGLLSHGAVVSREYRIPAVVGTRNATEQIEDGQLIEVDGDTGTVRVLYAVPAAWFERQPARVP